MPPTLPPEILDLIVDHLGGEPITLKSCCLVSNLWVPRTRRHLFARVEFDPEKSPIESWMKTFPDPSNSPAHYTRSLSISDLPILAASGSNPHTWIYVFRHLECLSISMTWSDDVQDALVPFHGLSPTLRSLSIACHLTPLSDIFDFVCSFPSIEDLELTSVHYGPADTWIIPQASPKFTGVLRIGKASTLHGTRSAIRCLVDLPDGLHFSKILADGCCETELTIDLLPRCFDTLETLRITRLWSDRPDVPPPLDLFNATRLRDVEFVGSIATVQWITIMIQTAKSSNLRSISIRLHSVRPPSVGGTVYSEWQDLDHLLVELWISRSIRPKVKYNQRMGGINGEEYVASLLPKLTNMGGTEAVPCRPV